MSPLDFSPELSPVVLALIGILVVSIALRILAILPFRINARSAPRKQDETVTVAAFLGSGGHTTELLQLLSALPSSRYVHRTYLLSSGDQFSSHKAQAAEASRDGARGKDYAIIELPRAREVHQSFLSTPISVLGSFFACLSVLLSRPPWSASEAATQGRRTDEARPWVDVLLMNGPGTCVPLVVAIYVLKFLNRPVPKLIYVESFARVKSLSLTAKILRHLVDRFVVQWDAEAEDRAAQLEKLKNGSEVKGSRGGDESRTVKTNGAECRGWLI